MSKQVYEGSWRPGDTYPESVYYLAPADETRTCPYCHTRIKPTEIIVDMQDDGQVAAHEQCASAAWED